MLFAVGPSATDWIVAVAACATCLIYVLLAWYASRQINEAKQLRADQAAEAERLRADQAADVQRRSDEAAALRRERSRPFVVAEMVPDLIITFRVLNVGQTLARNVKVTWDVFPTVTGNFANDPVWTGQHASVLFRDGIPFLPPGQHISTLFDNFPDRISKNLPMQFKVTVSYDDFNESNHYEESFVLDLDLYRGLRRIGKKDINDAAKELKRMADSMHKWSDTGGRGLRVSSHDRDKESAAETRSIRLTEFERNRKAKGLLAAAREELNQWRERHGWTQW